MNWNSINARKSLGLVKKATPALSQFTLLVMAHHAF
jgi:hypothetical protein